MCLVDFRDLPALAADHPISLIPLPRIHRIRPDKSLLLRWLNTQPRVVRMAERSGPNASVDGSACSPDPLASFGQQLEQKPLVAGWPGRRPGTTTAEESESKE